MSRTVKVVEDRRTQILDAAMRVFSQKGYSRSTNKDIAHEAGITPGLIYHYFESKDALLKAIIEARSPLRMMRSLPQEVFELPPEAFIHFMVQQVLSLVESEEFVQLIRMLLPEILHNPEVAPSSLQAFQQATGIVETYFIRKIEAGELLQGDVSMTTQIMISSVMGFVLRRQVIRDPIVLSYNHTEIASAISETILKNLLPG